MSSTISTLRVLIYEQQSAFTTQGYGRRRTVSTGVGPGDVDHVVITHMRYDHVGNVARFPHGARRAAELVDGAEERVIAGHDPRVRSMFDEVRPGCLDLTAPVTAG
jgi:glyoxylase-like metal-dependent hydrolase (beta-lactamase superfamily II)